MNSTDYKQNLINNFKRHFGEAAVSLYHVPGRSELGGNHTDHQNGQVLASAVDMYIKACVAEVEDSCGKADAGNCGAVELYSEGFGAIEVDITDLSMRESEKGTTEGLIRGVLAGLVEHGFNVGGFKAYISSDIPVGSGLSSSAAFEVLIGKIQSGLYNDDSISYVELAQIGQFAENVYYGKPCGLMDQIACASGKAVYIDFAYDGCPIIEEIDFDFENCGYEMCITNTGGSHANLTEEYAAVPAEMRAVAEMFSGESCDSKDSESCGRQKLRGITCEQIIENASKIREKAGDRALLRALHFVGETERAKAEAEALKDGNFAEFLRLVKASGDSSYKLLQNIYVGGRESVRQPIAVGLAMSEMILGEDGVCRVHGGGFAGTIQAFVKKDAVAKYKAAMDKIFGEGACTILKLGGR